MEKEARLLGKNIQQIIMDMKVKVQLNISLGIYTNEKENFHHI